MILNNLSPLPPSALAHFFHVIQIPSKAILGSQQAMLISERVAPQPIVKVLARTECQGCWQTMGICVLDTQGKFVMGR